MSVITYRQIAEAAGVSHVAVGYALRNRPGVSAATRQRIKAAAKKLGYKPNPMVAALMSTRRAGQRDKQGAIIVGLTLRRLEEREVSNSIAMDARKGIIQACGEAGFVFERLFYDDFGESPRRLFAALRARGCIGVIFMGEDVPEWCLAGWDRYAVGTVGNRRSNFSCNFSSSDHYNEAWLCMNELHRLGYRRVGFAMEETHWQRRNNYRAMSACTGWNTRHGIPRAPAPHLVKAWDPPAFLDWVRRQRPDAVVSADRFPLDWLREAGWRVPEDIGFANLNLQTSWQDQAGIRQDSFQVGVAAARLVINSINQNSYGVPAHPQSLQVVGEWHEGPTVRRQPGRRKESQRGGVNAR